MPLNQERLHIVDGEAFHLIPVLLFENLEELLRVVLIQAQSEVSIVAKGLEGLPEGGVGVGKTGGEGRGDNVLGGGGRGREGGEGVGDLGRGLCSVLVVGWLPDYGELWGGGDWIGVSESDDAERSDDAVQCYEAER